MQKGAAREIIFTISTLNFRPIARGSKIQGRALEPAPWMAPRSFAGSVLRAMGFGYAPLVGLPIAAIADLVRLTKPLLRARVGT